MDLAREVVCGQGKEQAFLTGEGIPDAQAAVLGPFSHAGGFGDPFPGGGIEFVEGPGAIAAGQEGGAQVGDTPFHPPFLVRRSRPTGLGFEAVVGGEGQDGGVVLDGIAVAREHPLFGVVVKYRARHAVQFAEGGGMGIEEVVQGCAEVASQDDAAGVAEHHHEAYQATLGAADGDDAEVGPVDLRRFPGQHLQAQEGLLLRLRE